jgi:hypothetical protein
MWPSVSGYAATSRMAAVQWAASTKIRLGRMPATALSSPTATPRTTSWRPRFSTRSVTFAKPWYRLRAMRVFRDKTNLSASPGLWQSIEIALGQSEWFLFMASPRAAQSHWVEQEITWWLRNRGVPWHSRGERVVFGFVLPGRPFKVVTSTYNNQRASRFALRKSMREPTATGS